MIDYKVLAKSICDLVYKDFQEMINEYFDREVSSDDYEAIQQFYYEYLSEETQEEYKKVKREIKNIKVYDWDEMKDIYIPIKDAQEYYQMNKNDYVNVDEFLKTYFISPRHKKYFINKKGDE